MVPLFTGRRFKVSVPMFPEAMQKKKDRREELYVLYANRIQGLTKKRRCSTRGLVTGWDSSENRDFDQKKLTTSAREGAISLKRLASPNGGGA